MSEQLCIVSNDIFSYFCEQSCEVATRIKVDDLTGTVASGALFNQEQIPSETLFYSTIMAQAERPAERSSRTSKQALDSLKQRIEAHPWIQVGGDATIGLGFCSALCLEVK